MVGGMSCSHVVFSFRAARTDDVPADSSIPSPKKTKSTKLCARTSSARDESVTCGERCNSLNSSYRLTWTIVTLCCAEYPTILC